MSKIEEFIKLLKENHYNNKIIQEGDKIKVGRSLDLEGSNIKELPENLTIGGSLDLRRTNITELPENLTVGWSLDLEGSNITQLPENLTVGGSLYLEGTNIIELPENLTVGGNLHLERTNIIELPENLTVGGNLHLEITNIKELPENLTVGGSLYLERTNIKELPDNLTVGGGLHLEGTNIIELPENLTVGGSLYLEGTNITELPENLTVGGNLYLEGTNIKDKEKSIKNINKIVKGYCKERKYIFFDNILWGNVKSVKKKGNTTIYQTPLGYCVVEDKLSAHGKTLKQAMKDLTFKKIQNRNTTEIVKDIRKLRKVTREQYRAITGACEFGTEQFCKQHHIEDLKEIELEELRKILINDYGAERFWELIDKE